MAYEDQQQITRLCVRCGLLLMQYGAESTVVVDLCKRLGAALGVASVECGLAFNGITITTIYNNRCITTLRASTTHVINVSMIIQIQRIVLDLERMPISNTSMTTPLEHALERFDALDKSTYPFWLVAMMVGLSCACFAHLAGGDLVVVAMTYLSAMTGQLVRYFLTKHHFNPFVVAGMTAFCASILSSLALLAHIGNDPHIAIASSVLLLVPSFPLINSLSDMLKGYMNIGIGRFMFVVILTLSSGVGISLALILLNIRQWGIA
ncbi:hypothetical protein MOMA_06426 [Moraxella macacae 0408225]|uniref:Threonine/serine exporter-like N-terminal domain-containing protein n=2 Tax=Moraxella macacae TaxID=765840 RepID=L2F5K8_9GAMM|nr:hypothetical protein MOMA_06426 [Moraxella macacae 0408225]